MPIRERFATYGVSTLAAATITVAALLQPWRGDVPAPDVPVERPAARRAVDVVFAVDTTGSMGGLIEGAKRTVWSIATHIRKTDPEAELRIGLVAYRDFGDDYVTREFPLTGDLDAVFAELASYRANGGGDTPENVDAALHAGLRKMQWRDDAKKLMFLVGDAPPASRGDVPRFDLLAREAAGQQIIINTIQCGKDHATQLAFQQIAELGGGQFSTVQQDGGVQHVATPYDDKLAELSATIDSTVIIVGGDHERAAYRSKMSAAEAAPAPAKAARATYYATEGGGAAGDLRDANDLVGNVAAGKADVMATPAEALPEDLRGLAKPALKAEIARRVEARNAAQAELKKLAKERDEYLRAKGKSSDSFDAKVNAAIDAQLK